MRHRDNGKVVPGGTLHRAPAHVPSEGAGTKHAGFLLHLSRREHGTQECTVGGAVKGLWASPVSPLSQAITVLTVVTLLFRYYLTAMSNCLHSKGGANSRMAESFLPETTSDLARGHSVSQRSICQRFPRDKPWWADVEISVGTEFPPPKHDTRDPGDPTVVVTSPRQKARLPTRQIPGGQESCAPRPTPSWKILEPLHLMAQEDSRKWRLQVNSDP